MGLSMQDCLLHGVSCQMPTMLINMPRRHQNIIAQTAMLRYACYVTLCHAVLCYARLCYAVLCCAVLGYATQCNAMQHCSVLCWGSLHSSTGRACYLNSLWTLVDITQLTWKGRTGLLMSAACSTAFTSSTRSSSFSIRKGPAVQMNLFHFLVKLYIV